MKTPRLIANDLFQSTMEFLECDVFFNYLAKPSSIVFI